MDDEYRRMDGNDMYEHHVRSGAMENHDRRWYFMMISDNDADDKHPYVRTHSYTTTPLFSVIPV